MSGKDTITIPFESKVPVPTLKEIDAYLVREGWIKKGDPRHESQYWAHPDHKELTLECPTDESAIFWKNTASYVIRQVIEVTSEEPFYVITEMLFPGKQSDMLFHHFVETKGEMEDLSERRAQRMEGCRQEESGE